jgi:hypothetical protein
LRQGSGQPGLEMTAVRTGLLTGLKMLTHAVVDDALLQAKARDNVVGAVAVVDIAVENCDALVDDNYVGRLEAFAGRVREAGLPLDLSTFIEGKRHARWVFR